MSATDYSSDEDGENVEKDYAQRPRAISGDDLGDSFALDDEPGNKKGWVDEILERKDANDSEDEDEDDSEDLESAEDTDEDEESEEEEDDENECEKTLSLKDWEQSDDDDVGTDLEEDKETNEHDEAIGDEDVDKKSRNKTNKTELKKGVEYVDAKKPKASGKHTSTKSDIPFIIEAPKNLEELSSLLENRSNDDIIVIINRIRASNAIKLAAENRKKMQVSFLIGCSDILPILRLAPSI